MIIILGLIVIVASLLAFTFGLNMGLSISSEDEVGKILDTLGVAGTWLASLGTISAVVVSLWLAHQQSENDKEVLDITLNAVCSPPLVDDFFVAVKVISKGNRPSTVSGISFSGKGAKTAMLVSDFYHVSQTLPRQMPYGDAATFIMVEGMETHICKYVNDHLAGNFHRLRLTVSTTTQNFEVKPKDGFLSYIKSNAAEQAANKQFNQDSGVITPPPVN